MWLRLRSAAGLEGRFDVLDPKIRGDELCSEGFPVFTSAWFGKHSLCSDVVSCTLCLVCACT